MTRIRKNISIAASIVLCVLLGWLYYTLEDFFYSDAGCGCSSGCSTYIPTYTSRLIGYGMMLLSALLFISAIGRFKGISRYWTLAAAGLFALAVYGNGFMIFNKGVCGLSLYETRFFIMQTKLGDFAKPDAETLHPDTLSAGAYKGKLLGYAFKGNTLTLFRIGAAPLRIKTRFLFWKIRNNVVLNGISYGLNTHRNFEAEKIRGHYEFIGGQGMSEKDFSDEFVLTQKELSGKHLLNKRIVNANDGSTRFLFETN